MNKIKKTYLVDTAYEKILAMILKGEITVGVPLLELEIAEQFNMSRTPVHDAIKQLATQGYLTIIPKKGAYLKQVSLNELIMGYEALEALEGMAASLVAEKIQTGELSLSDLDEMESCIDLMAENCDSNNIDAWISADTAFHSKICSLANNSYITTYTNNLKNQFTFVSTKVTPFYVDRIVANEEHKEILKAIQSGDIQKTQSAAQKQRRNIRNNLKQHSHILF